MKLTKEQLLFSSLMIKLVEGIYNDGDKEVNSLLQQQKENRDNLLQELGKALLTYQIVDGFMNLTERNLKKEKTSLGKLIKDQFNSEIKNEDLATNKVLTDTSNKSWGANSYLMSIGSNFDIEKLDRKKSEKIISEKIDGKTYSDRIWKNKNDVASIMQKKINDFLDGKIDVNKIEKEIKDLYNSNGYNTKRLLENEISRVQNAVNEEWFKEKDIEYYLYDATLDRKTCDKCAKLDGKVYEKGEKRPELPLHIRCRCTYVGLPDKNWRPKTRRDNETGENIDYKTYKEWYNEKYPIDYINWDDKRGERKYKFGTGNLRLAKIRDIKKAKKYLEDHGMELVIGDKEALQEHGGGFEPAEAKVYLPDNPTYLAVRHEIYHAQQYNALGKEKYMSQTRKEREEHVYSQIMKHKEEFTSDEIWNAQRYIYFIRNGDFPFDDWPGYDD